MFTNGYCEVPLWFEKRFRSEHRAPETRTILRLVSSRNPMPGLRKGYVDSARSQLNVFSKRYTTVLVDLLREEKESIEWRNLHVGAEGGVNCEHMQALQALLTNILLRLWEWQEARKTDLEPEFSRFQTEQAWT